MKRQSDVRVSCETTVLSPRSHDARVAVVTATQFASAIWTIIAFTLASLRFLPKQRIGRDGISHANRSFSERITLAAWTRRA